MATRFIPLMVVLLGLALLFNISFAVAQKPAVATVSMKTSTDGKTDVKTDTAKVDYLSPAEQEILAEINRARAEPQTYIAYLEELKKYFKGNQLARPGKQSMTTMEGIAAVDDAITYLRTVKPLPPLTTAKGLCLAAKDHTLDMLKSGLEGHKGSDGSIPDDRVARYGQWQMAVGEAIIYKYEAPRDVVLGMLIDDGTPSRGHRKNIFNSNFRVIGINVSTPGNSSIMGVVDYAGGFTEKNAADATKPAAKKF